MYERIKSDRRSRLQGCGNDVSSTGHAGQAERVERMELSALWAVGVSAKEALADMPVCRQCQCGVAGAWPRLWPRRPQGHRHTEREERATEGAKRRVDSVRARWWRWTARAVSRVRCELVRCGSREVGGRGREGRGMSAPVPHLIRSEIAPAAGALGSEEVDQGRLRLPSLVQGARRCGASTIQCHNTTTTHAPPCDESSPTACCEPPPNGPTDPAPASTQPSDHSRSTVGRYRRSRLERSAAMQATTRSTWPRSS